MTAPQEQPLNERIIAISGGGIAGLTCALALAHHGFYVKIFEKTNEFSELGAGIQLSPNGTKILQKLGLMDALKAKAIYAENLKLFDGIGGKHLNSVPFGKAIEEKYSAPYMTVKRSQLHKILADACKAHNKITLHLGCPIEALEIAPSHVSFHAQNFEQKITAQALIAADGVWSKLREQQFGTKAQFMGEVAWRNQLPREMIPKDFPIKGPSLWLGPKAHMVFYPIFEGKIINMVATEPLAKNAPSPLKTSKASHLIEQYKAWHPSIKTILQQSFEASPWLPWPIYQINPKAPWIKGRFALIGDSAHAMPPFMAQGGCFAIEDAYVIADCLKAAGEDLALGFQRYEALRRPRVEKLFKKVSKNQAIYHMSPPFSWARNFVMKRLPPEKLLQQQDWVYRWEY